MSSVVLLFSEGKSQVICSLLLLLLITIDFCNGQQSCNTPESYYGVCVAGIKCRWVKDALDEYGAKLPATTRTFLINSQCQGSILVCCRPKDIIPDETPPIPVYQINPTGMEILLKQDCGRSDLYRVAHGQEADPGSFPWMALLKYDMISKDMNPYLCGGALITQRYVLTAAHCRQQQPIIGVVLGEHNTKTEIDCKRKGRGKVCTGPAVEYGVEKVIPHREYLRSQLLNDIMLIKLDRDVELKVYIIPICLPLANASMTIPEEYFIAGWGGTESASASNTLQYAKVKHQNRAQCFELYRDARINADRHICAAGDNLVDTCKGDSGGPLFFLTAYQDSARYIQFGIVSFGVQSCGSSRYSTIFTNVTNQLAWITNNIVD